MTILEYHRESQFSNRRRMRRMTSDIMPSATGRVALLVIVVTVALGLIFMVSIANAETVCLENPDGGLNVRTGPGMEYKALFKISHGAVVKVIEEKDGWALVNWPKYVDVTEPMGWVSMDYLAEDDRQ